MTLTATPALDDTFTVARRAMIDSQLRTSGVTHACAVEPMGRVAREDFVPAAARAVAYMDRAVPLGDGHWLPAPLVHGLILQEAAPQVTDRAIVVDGGSGYLPELLRGQVASVEVLTPEQALAKGKGEPATLLLIDGAIEHLPAALSARLTDDARVVTGLVDNGVTSVAAFDKPQGWSF